MEWQYNVEWTKDNIWQQQMHDNNEQMMMMSNG